MKKERRKKREKSEQDVEKRGRNRRQVGRKFSRETKSPSNFTDRSHREKFSLRL
jgi:hypothetical protein